MKQHLVHSYGLRLYVNDFPLSPVFKFSLCQVDSEVCNQPEHVPVKVEKPSKASAELSLEQVFAQLDISDYAATFTKEGIDMDALFLCNEDDLKEGGLPLGK